MAGRWPSGQVTVNSLHKIAHYTDLHLAVDERRAAAGLSSLTWAYDGSNNWIPGTSPIIKADGTTLHNLRAAHVTDIRTQLLNLRSTFIDPATNVAWASDAALLQAAIGQSSFTDTIDTNMTTKIVHVNELRAVAEKLTWIRFNFDTSVGESGRLAKRGATMADARASTATLNPTTWGQVPGMRHQTGDAEPYQIARRWYGFNTQNLSANIMSVRDARFIWNSLTRTDNCDNNVAFQIQFGVANIGVIGTGNWDNQGTPIGERTSPVCNGTINVVINSIGNLIAINKRTQISGVNRGEILGGAPSTNINSGQVWSDTAGTIYILVDAQFFYG